MPTYLSNSRYQLQEPNNKATFFCAKHGVVHVCTCRSCCRCFESMLLRSSLHVHISPKLRKACCVQCRCQLKEPPLATGRFSCYYSDTSHPHGSSSIAFFGLNLAFPPYSDRQLRYPDRTFCGSTVPLRHVVQSTPHLITHELRIVMWCLPHKVSSLVRNRELQT